MVDRKWNDKWVFVHIPKTGGTTIKNYLSKYIDLYHYDGVNVPFGATEYKMLFGHLDPNKFPKRKKITWLRHPVNRVISNYLHWKWRILYSPKKYIIVDSQVRKFPENTSVIDFAKSTTHVYRYFTKYNPQMFDYIGFCENMNGHIEKLCNLLDISFDESLVGHERKDQKPKKDEITQKEIEELNWILKDDVNFYNKLRKQYDL